MTDTFCEGKFDAKSSPDQNDDSSCELAGVLTTSGGAAKVWMCNCSLAMISVRLLNFGHGRVASRLQVARLHHSHGHRSTTSIVTIATRGSTHGNAVCCHSMMEVLMGSTPLSLLKV